MESKKPSLERLEEIAKHHLAPPAAHMVDVKVQYYDVLKMLPYVVGDRVLEMGYGDGMWTKNIIERYGHTYLVDASRSFLTTVKNKYADKVTCFESYYEEFTPPDTMKFNTVIASHVLEHIYDPVSVLRRAKGWIAEKGRMIIVVPNAESLHRELAVVMGIQKKIYDLSESDNQVGHVRVYDLNQLRSHVAEAGYRIIVERGLFLKTLPNGMMTNYKDELIKAMVDISDKLPANLMANIALVVEVM